MIAVMTESTASVEQLLFSGIWKMFPVAFVIRGEMIAWIFLESEEEEIAL